MTSIPNETVIVVAEERKRRSGALWIAAGAALLLTGGSTFALWSDGDTFTGGSITAGDLDLTTSAATTFWDVSNDRVDAAATVTGTDGVQLGHAISSISDWRIVPGDKVAASFTATVALEGDNLVARVGLDGLDDITQTISGTNYSYEVYYGGSPVVTETALPRTADAPLLYLSAPRAGQAAGSEDATGGVLGATGTAIDGVTAQTTVFELPATTAEVTVVVYASFYDDLDGDFRYQSTDTTVTERVDVTAADTLADLNLSLDQVRDTGAQFS